jgi:hypothetical protein
MELLELMKKTLSLAEEGHLEVHHIEDLCQRVVRAESQVALKEGHLGAYEEEAQRALNALDGTHLMLQQWREAQRLLVATRQEVRLLREAIFFVREEVERQLALGLHNRARARATEARA